MRLLLNFVSRMKQRIADEIGIAQSKAGNFANAHAETVKKEQISFHRPSLVVVPEVCLEVRAIREQAFGIAKIK